MKKILSGKWIVKYDDNGRKAVLELLYKINESILKSKIIPKIRIVNVGKEIEENIFFYEKESILIINCNYNFKEIQKIQKVSNEDFNYIEKFHVENFENILFTYPALSSDKRWESIGVPSSTIFLASMLKKYGYNINYKKILLPYGEKYDFFEEYDLIAITLFEDLLVESGQFLADLKKRFNKIIAAGGPLITLNPMEAIYYLDDVNIFIRGEGELLFSKILEKLKRGEIFSILEEKGIFLDFNNQLIISDLDYTNMVYDFSEIELSYDFINEIDLRNGIEINLSRGCKRGCIFCSKVQGREIRKLPIEKFAAFINGLGKRIDKSRFSLEYGKTLNINDDDLLQDVEYGNSVFNLVKNEKWKLWGIQTSINSFFKDDKIDEDVIRRISNIELFVDDKPLLWIGTDGFNKKRGKFLAKRIPSLENIKKLLLRFENEKILNYHYWISSDHGTDWSSFIEEFISIYNLLKKYNYFKLLAHAPFIVPYSSTPLYKLATKNEKILERIKYKKILNSESRYFRFPLVDRIETKFPALNKLLSNEKSGKYGLFETLKEENYWESFIVIYNFLKEDRINFENIGREDLAYLLRNEEKKIEEFLSSF